MTTTPAPHRLPLTGRRCTLVGQIVGVRECPQRGVRIVIREWTEDGPFPYPTRVKPSEIRLTATQREHLLATDDRGTLVRPGTPAHALTRMGLTEPHLFGWRLTEAGRAVLAHLMSEHRTRVHELGAPRGFNMARNRWELPRDRYAFTCTCGAGARQMGADEARGAARRHREDGWVPYPHPSAADRARARRLASA